MDYVNRIDRRASRAVWESGGGGERWGKVYALYTRRPVHGEIEGNLAVVMNPEGRHRTICCREAWGWLRWPHAAAGPWDCDDAIYHVLKRGNCGWTCSRARACHPAIMDASTSPFFPMERETPRPEEP
jgi:hypothetical protein